MRSVKYLALIISLAASLVLGMASPAPQSKQTENPAPKQQQKVSSMTGCVDQQDGRYVLIDDHNREVIANLEADGFPVEGFAKHVGHKVTVRGISNAGSTQPRFKVRAIETVSDQCAPQLP